jgi:hypothetical protein
MKAFRLSTQNHSLFLIHFFLFLNKLSVNTSSKNYTPTNSLTAGGSYSSALSNSSNRSNNSNNGSSSSNQLRTQAISNSSNSSSNNNSNNSTMSKIENKLKMDKQV